MPEGEIVSQEVIVTKSHDELHRHVLLYAVPIFAAAKYKLVSKDDNTIAFERKFLPSTAQVICIAVLILVLIAQSGAGEFTPVAALGWVVVLVMIFYRRRENLTLDLRPNDGGTRLIAVGTHRRRAKPLRPVPWTVGTGRARFRCVAALWSQ